MAEEITKINGDSRFTAFQHDELGLKHFLAFYEKKEDVGDLKKAVGIIEFSSWKKLFEWVFLQAKCAQEIQKGLNHRKSKNANNN